MIARPALCRAAAMLTHLRTLLLLLAKLLIAISALPPAVGTVGPTRPTRGGRWWVVVGTLREAEAVLDLVESLGATDRSVSLTPGGSFAVRWR